MIESRIFSINEDFLPLEATICCILLMCLSLLRIRIDHLYELCIWLLESIIITMTIKYRLSSSTFLRNQNYP